MMATRTLRSHLQMENLAWRDITTSDTSFRRAEEQSHRPSEEKTKAIIESNLSSCGGSLVVEGPGGTRTTGTTISHLNKTIKSHERIGVLVVVSFGLVLPLLEDYDRPSRDETR